MKISSININRNFYILFFVTAFALLSAYSLYRGFPNPIITDDHSYLLAAHTFAQGHLSNPTHPLWQFFENAHILSTPTYMSKYQPGYGAVMALGQVLFGSTFYGVILSTALFATCFLWFANALVSPRVALTGGIFVLIIYGVFSYWGRSYFGGASLSAAGTCLVLGAYFHSRKNGKLGHAVQFCVGCAIMFFTRPYEGGSITLAITLCALWDIYKKNITLAGSRNFIFILALGGLFIIAFQAYYNSKVTGSYTVLPYQEQIKQYMTARYFLFQHESVPVHRSSTQLLDALHSVWEMAKFNEMKDMPWPQKIAHSVKEVIQTSIFFVLFLLSCVFCLFYIRPDAHDRRLMFIFFFCVGMSSLIVWKANHYLFALIVCAIIFCLKTAAGLIIKMRGDESIVSFFKKYQALVFVLLIIYVLIGLYMWGMILKKSHELAVLDKSPIKNWAIERPEVAKTLDANGYKNLVFVHYRDYRQSGQEYMFDESALYDATLAFVYNDNPDIDANTTIFAHDLGAADNNKLIEYYKAKGEDRKLWLIDLKDVAKGYSLKPY